MNFGFDPSTIALAVGGALGAFLLAVVSKGYLWRSKFTVADTVMGAGLGIALPIVPLSFLFGLIGVNFELPISATATALTPAQKGAVMFGFSWAFLDTIRERLLDRWQPRNRRQADSPPQ